MKLTSFSTALKPIIALLLLLASACSDVSPAISEMTEIAIDSKGNYIHIAWVNDDTIIAAYSPLDSRSIKDSRLYRYDLITKSWSDITLPVVDGCVAGRSLFVERIPDGSLGFLYHCTAVSRSPKGFLFTWDLTKSQGPIQWAEYQEPFQALGFTFAPDMSEVIQGELGFEFYRVKQGQQPIHILENFFRVAHPTWSPDGEKIAFFGIPKPDNIGTPFSIDPEGFRARYDIYLMDPDQSDVQVVLEDIIFVGHLKWSPGGDFLTFTGEYRNTQGIWAMNKTTSEITQLWDQWTGYDWSPNGKQLVIAKSLSDESTDEQGDQPVIVDLPLELQDPP